MTMGNYEVLSHTESPECSLRLIRVTRDRSVHIHYHKQTTQIYVVLEGVVKITVGDTMSALRPFETVRVPVEKNHSLSTEEEALVLSISIPPLQRDDQHMPSQR